MELLLTLMNSGALVDPITSTPLQVGGVGTTVAALLEALSFILTPETLFLLVLATLLGLIMGASPGVGGPTTLAILIPVTYALEPKLAFIVLAASIGGINFGGSLTAILLNTPGTPVNAATLFDGHPMARNGRSAEAIAASAVASGSGAVIGLLLVIVLSPFLLSIILLFSPPEFFWLAVLGLLLIAVATPGNKLANIISGGLGLMLSFHGINRVIGTTRFTWGVDYLAGGISPIPTMLGMFAIAEMINLLSKNRSIATELSIKDVGRQRIDGIMDVVRNWKLFIRSAALGWIIGVIPGVGGTLANFVAYAQAKAGFTGDEIPFGEGNVKGMIASESSNDAKDGGSLIPTLALGIPGSVTMAILLGAFTLHGINPGPTVLRDHLPLVFVIILTLIFANILTSAIGLLTTKQIASVTKIPLNLLAPLVIVVALAGAYVIRSNFNDVVLAIAFAFVGILFIKFSVSRVPLLLGLVLGPVVERNFFLTLQIFRGDYSVFFTRPISAGIIVLTAIAVLIFTDLVDVRSLLGLSSPDKHD